MKKPGRPSSLPKKLKDGYYMLVYVKNSKNTIRIYRESLKELELLKIQYRYHNLEYLGQVKDNIWLDGKYKGKLTSK